jgi:hypothetical protein
MSRPIRGLSYIHHQIDGVCLLWHSRGCAIWARANLTPFRTSWLGSQARLHDKFKIGGDASAAAGPVGRDTQASTDIALKAELLTSSRAKRLLPVST